MDFCINCGKDVPYFSDDLMLFLFHQNYKWGFPGKINVLTMGNFDDKV